MPEHGCWSVLRKFKEDVMDPQTKQKNAEIKTLKTEITLRDEQIESLLSTVTELEANVGKLTKGLNDIEQYGRRHLIRLNNVDLEDVSECESI